MRRLLAHLAVLKRARQDTASNILRAIEAHSGAPVGEIISACSMPAGTVYYHIERLERDGAIRTVVSGRRRLVFLAGDARTIVGDHHAMSILRGKMALVIARKLAEKGPLPILELAEGVGGSERAVYYHVKRLREAGLIDSGSPRRYGQLSATPKLKLLLAELTPQGILETEHAVHSTDASV